jgi:hypothetical protein
MHLDQRDPGTYVYKPESDDEVDKLNKFVEPDSSGALSDEEFGAAKARLLGRLLAAPGTRRCAEVPASP